MSFKFPYCSKTGRQVLFMLLGILYILPGAFLKASAQDANGLFLENGKHYEIPYRTDTGTIMRNLNFAKQLRRTNPDSAFNVFNNILKESTLSSFNDGIALALIEAGDILLEKGQCEQALTYLKQAIPYSIIAKRKFILPTAYISISSVYGYEGKYEQTLQYLYWASLLIEKNPSNDIAAIINGNMGVAMLQLERYPQAIYYLDKAEKNFQQVRDSDFLAMLVLNKGIAYSHLRNWEQCQYYFQTALNIGIERKLANVQFLALMGIGNIYLDSNLPEKALSYCLETQNVQGKVNPYYLQEATMMLGKTYFKLHKYKQATSSLEKALTVDENFKTNKSLIKTHELLAAVYAQSGQNAKAYEQEKISKTLSDSLSSQQMAQKATQTEIKYRTAEKDKELVQQQLQINEQENYLKRKNFLINGILAVSALLVALLLSLYRINQHRQKIRQLYAMMDGEEKERSRIGQELHDGIGGMLVSAKLNLGSIKEEYPETVYIKKLDDVMGALNDTTTEIRQTAHNLMPDVLTKHSLEEALLIYCANINTSNKLEIDLQFNGNLKQLGKSVELMFYRIIQELIQNIIKHANATYAIIQIIQDKNRLNLIVEDNGTGFDINENNEGLGLHNLRMRVKALSGYISISSAIGKSTTVYIEFELQQLKKRDQYAYQSRNSR